MTPSKYVKSKPKEKQEMILLDKNQNLEKTAKKSLKNPSEIITHQKTIPGKNLDNPKNEDKSALIPSINSEIHEEN